MTTAVYPDKEVIWAESTTGDEFQCVHVDDWLLARARIAELEDALRRVVRDANNYAETTKLSPNPGRTECWDSVAHAKAVLAKTHQQ